MKISLHTYLQHVLPHHLCSRIMGMLANIKIKWWKNWAIQRFVFKYGVVLDDALEPRIDQYKNFNEFFTRKLKATARPVVEDRMFLASPVDGRVSELGEVQENSLFQAKGKKYNLNQLVANDSMLAQMFNNGFYSTFYLAPRDYHRIHMPIDGTLKAMWHVPGRLFSVNPATVAEIPGLFARNERVICLFSTEFGDMALILVGAFYVASIHTVWAGDITPSARCKISYKKYSTNDEQQIFLEKGAEVGHFKLGSTVILLLAKSFSFKTNMSESDIVKMGQNIGKISLKT